MNPALMAGLMKTLGVNPEEIFKTIEGLQATITLFNEKLDRIETKLNTIEEKLNGQETARTD